MDKFNSLYNKIITESDGWDNREGFDKTVSKMEKMLRMVKQMREEKRAAMTPEEQAKYDLECLYTDLKAMDLMNEMSGSSHIRNGKIVHGRDFLEKMFKLKKGAPDLFEDLLSKMSDEQGGGYGNKDPELAQWLRDHDETDLDNPELCDFSW